MGEHSDSRFVDTLALLRDCYEHVWDKKLSQKEAQARRQIIDLCLLIQQEQALSDLLSGDHLVSKGGHQ